MLKRYRWAVTALGLGVLALAAGFLDFAVAGNPILFLISWIAFLGGILVAFSPACPSCRKSAVVRKFEILGSSIRYLGLPERTCSVCGFSR